MTKEFIPYEEALALKELGFNETCLAFYTEDYKQLLFLHKPGLTPNLLTKPFLAPLYQQAFRWFREKHELSSWVTAEIGLTITYCYTITGENHGTIHKAYIKSYEKAELTCLQKLIELQKHLNR